LLTEGQSPIHILNIQKQFLVNTVSAHGKAKCSRVEVHVTIVGVGVGIKRIEKVMDRER